MENQLKGILAEFNIENSKAVQKTLEKLTHNSKVFELTKAIKEIKNQILQLFTMHQEKEEFQEAHFPIPNANVKKEYNYQFDLEAFPNIKIEEIRNLESVGLQFDAETCSISGIPTVANTIEIQIVFFNTSDENLETDIKQIPFIINADPKDLWLDKPSPRDARFPKEETATFKSDFLDKKIVIASKRGRSHAHNGTFRDDDFLVKILPDNWSIIAVSDGAGSAKYSRAGSQFACEQIAENFDNSAILTELSSVVTSYFSEDLPPEVSAPDENIENESLAQIENTSFNKEEDKNVEKLKQKSIIINSLYKNVKDVHTKLIDFANKEEINLKDIHATLIFTLLKKFEFGYVILSFGVGDCPINVLESDEYSVQLLNFLDVGESSGATRFITMPEIFSRPDMQDRFGIHCFKDFSKLFLMTDGIYDPKFVVESKLENMESWKHFLRDLNGENEDHAKVNFDQDINIETELSTWMDFWSKGNHDDRTLAIIY